MSIPFSVPAPSDVARSIFVDHGPIAKPPLTLASGSNATVVDPVTVTLPGGLITSSMLGMYASLTGGLVNAGTYKIAAVLGSSRVRLGSSLRSSDPANGTLSWAVFDPRNGQIADSPADVEVKINGSQVAPEAVFGLLGQIVLPAPGPQPTDDVKVSYSWIDNPTVEIRRLNSPEFRLNSWNRDVACPAGGSGHMYRYNNTLVSPKDYVATDIRAPLDQPLQRDLKYRAFQRAYTPVLNDPTLLLLNSPIHKIAFPPLSRTIASTFVSYGATVLPDDDAVAPWQRTGTGTATVADDLLTVGKTQAGPFPTGSVLFWTRPIDLTFDHVFAATWRMSMSADAVTDGVFSGIAAGYSNASKTFVLGLLDDGGTRKMGLLVGSDPALLSSWAGGLDSTGTATGLPVAFDWTTVHSYRLFRDLTGTVRVFVDGDVTETLRILAGDVPFLEEVSAPFNQIQGVFFGSLSYPATNTSTWSFFRYDILPTNPLQTSPSVFVSYEGTTSPEFASQPWTPVGSAGTETIVGSNFLLLDSTSATTTGVEGQTGLVGGDFRGYDRIEPLLGISSDVVLDLNVQVRTFTHGITPNAVMAAIDDGSRFVQLCFFSDQAAPKISYGGRSLPELFQPNAWTSMGTQSAALHGRVLRITDAGPTDGLIYFIDDVAAITGDPTRAVSPTTDYMLEFRTLVRSFSPDPVTGFCGVNADVYDGLRSLGVMLTQQSGALRVALHSDGVVVQSFSFNWNDGAAHTYRMVKNTAGDLVSLFVDSVYLGSVAYSLFSVPGASQVGVISFGSLVLSTPGGTTPASLSSMSVVDWSYCNVWKVLSTFKKYVGLWKGTDPNALTGYHLPLKAAGTDAVVNNNALGDGVVDLLAAGVVPGDYLVIDAGANKGAYAITGVAQHSLTVATPFPSFPTTATYRVPAEVDWTASHRYRVVRDPAGGISLLLDAISAPLVRIGYDEVELPQSALGVARVINGPLASVVFGAFDPTNLSQTYWDCVRYGITSTSAGQRTAPHHQFLNQENVMASPEHLFTNRPHTHTNFLSSSTGIPPELEPDFLRDPGLVAYTLLNEGTPLVPSTQTFEVRQPSVVNEPVAGLNMPSTVLNSQAFTVNESSVRAILVIPPDVLYNSLQVYERTTGAVNLLAPFDDRLGLGTVFYRDESCLTYEGDVLPENDASAATPWSFAADDPGLVTRTTFNGILTFGTTGVTRAVYKSDTPLPDAPGLVTQVTYRLKLLSDATFGLGDTQVRFGFSAPEMSLALGFVTAPSGERHVLLFDRSSGAVVGGRRFDFLDGNFHSYRIMRDPSAAQLSMYIDA